MMKHFFRGLVGVAVVLLGISVEAAILDSQLTPGNMDELIFTDVDSDNDPDILERWWNGKRCRWMAITEMASTTSSSRRSVT